MRKGIACQVSGVKKPGDVRTIKPSSDSREGLRLVEEKLYSFAKPFRAVIDNTIV